MVLVSLSSYIVTRTRFALRRPLDVFTWVPYMVPGFVLSQHQDRKKALTWLTVDAIAPFVGAIVGSTISISEYGLGHLLAVYAGFFLFMGATDLLPEAHQHPSWKRVFLTAGGFVATFFVARVAAGV